MMRPEVGQKHARQAALVRGLELSRARQNRRQGRGRRPPPAAVTPTCRRPPV